MSITDFLSKVYSEPIKAVTATGYTASNFDILMGSLKRSKIINENYISDFQFLELDKNFLRKNSNTLNKLSQLSSKLAITTQLSTTIDSFLSMSKIYDFFPPNLKSVIGDYIGIADSGMLILNNIADGSFIKNLKGCLMQDILGMFTSKYMNMTDISNMAISISEAYEYKDKIKNMGIRGLLSLPFKSFLPDGYDVFFEKLQLLDNLYSVFGNGQLLQNFLNQFKELFSSFSDKTVSSSSQINSTYSNSVMSLNDVFGINEVESFKEDLKSYTATEITSIVDTLSKTNNLTPTQITDITNIIISQYTTDIDNMFESNIGLPSLKSVIDGINVNVYNQTIQNINEMFDDIGNTILLSLNIKYDSVLKPIDFLYNLKRNIEKRKKFKSTGTSLDDFENITNSISSVMVVPASEKNIDELYSNLSEVLGNG